MTLLTWFQYLVEKKYELVKTGELSLPEFRSITIPDKFLRAVCMEMATPAGSYHLDHKRIGSNIHIESSHTDLSDFLRVQRLVTDITGGIPGEHILNPETICNELVRRDLTHALITDFSERYSKAFSNTRIVAAYYCCVPESAFKNPGLPEGKLEIVSAASQQSHA